MRRKFFDKKSIHRFLILLLCLCDDVLPENPYRTENVRHDYPKGCAYLRCKKGDQCVNRKFWCKNPPCPSMLYCSKSRKESLRGPSSCDAVTCTKGFMCIVRVRHCRWDKACEQQIARCVSEREFYEGPASCVDFHCPTNLRCILRESLCAKPPCKLVKSCANIKDVKAWYEGCKSLGCLSEHECFLRRPSHECSNSSCNHTPDCSAKSEEELEANEQCRGWICPKGHECAAHTPEPCKHDTCRISRTCHTPLITPATSTLTPKHSWRDDIKLSFYSKLDKNSSSAYEEDIFIPQPPTSSLAPIVQNDNKEVTNAMSGERSNTTVTYKSSIYEPPSSIPVSTILTPTSSSSTISSHEVQPTITSLSTWLNHLKQKTGVDAVEEWVQKSENNENFAEFNEWLESVKVMLGSVAYGLWLEEVRAMTVTSPSFQKWLLQPNVTDLLVSHNSNEPKTTKDDGNDGDEHSQDKEKTTNGKVKQPESMKSYDFMEKDYMFPTKYDTTTIATQFSLRNLLPTSPRRPQGIPPSPPFQGVNDGPKWSEYDSFDSRIFQQGVPQHPNYGNAVPWINEAMPFQGLISSMGQLNRWYQQFNTNWSFHQPFTNPADFHRAWQEQIFRAPNPNWHSSRISINPWNFQHHDMTPTIHHRPSEVPVTFYAQNSTGVSQPASWIKYLPGPYQYPGFVNQNNYGNFPKAEENFDYRNWQLSSYPLQNLPNVPHRRSKHSYSTYDAGEITSDERNEKRSKEKLLGIPGEPEQHSPGFSGISVDPRLLEYYLRLLDSKGRYLDEKNNPEDPSVFYGLSRTYQVKDETHESLPNPYFSDNQDELLSPRYYWFISYPDEVLQRIVGTDLPLPSTPAGLDILKDQRRYDHFSKNNGDNIRDISFENREEAPGTPMVFPDLWDSRYRSTFSSKLNKLYKERVDYRDLMKRVYKNRQIISTSPKNVPSSRREVLREFLPDSREDFQEVEDHNYSDESDVGDKNNHEDEDERTYPMLLSLYGYIQSQDEDLPPDSMIPWNSTIFPVYFRNHNIEPEVKDDEFDYQALNFFKNPKYGGSPDFPNNLKNAFYFEAPMIVKNRTSKSDLEIRNAKWEYEDEYDDEKLFEKSSRHLSQPAELDNSAEGLLETQPPGVDQYEYEKEDVPENGDWNEDIDYKDVDSVDYDLVIRAAIDGDDSMSEEIPEVSFDSLYDDGDHRRFKKNHP